jgi:hypothetical protein
VEDFFSGQWLVVRDWWLEIGVAVGQCLGLTFRRATIQCWRQSNRRVVAHHLRLCKVLLDRAFSSIYRGNVARQLRRFGGYKKGPAGPALPAKTPGKPGVVESGGAESGAFDPDLTKIVAAWPSLPEPIKRAMLALIG